MRSKIKLASATLLAALALTACADVSESKHKTVEPYTKEAIGVDGLYRVTLAESAFQRLAIKTSLVVQARSTDGTFRTVIPYSGIIYDLNGETWTYTSPSPLTYIRERIRVDHIDGDRIFLFEGPKVGTAVVVAGAAELFGIEFGLGK